MVFHQPKLPVEKYPMSQNGSSPSLNIKNVWNHPTHLVIDWTPQKNTKIQTIVKYIMNIPPISMACYFLNFPLKLSEHEASGSVTSFSWQLDFSPCIFSPVVSPSPSQGNIWVFPKIEVLQNGWFIMENPIKIGNLGVPLFLETPICNNNTYRFGITSDALAYNLPWLEIFQGELINSSAGFGLQKKKKMSAFFLSIFLTFLYICIHYTNYTLYDLYVYLDLPNKYSKDVTPIPFGSLSNAKH